MERNAKPAPRGGEVTSLRHRGKFLPTSAEKTDAPKRMLLAHICPIDLSLEIGTLAHHLSRPPELLDLRRRLGTLQNARGPFGGLPRLSNRGAGCAGDRSGEPDVSLAKIMLSGAKSGGGLPAPRSHAHVGD
jgi:hypothetical protein